MRSLAANWYFRFSMWTLKLVVRKFSRASLPATVLAFGSAIAVSANLATERPSTSAFCGLSLGYFTPLSSTGTACPGPSSPPSAPVT